MAVRFEQGCQEFWTADEARRDRRFDCGGLDAAQAVRWFRPKES